MRYVRSDPRDESVNPPTQLAADGQTRLRRYRVDAVIYAPSINDAHRRLEHDIYIDAASIQRG